MLRKSIACPHCKASFSYNAQKLPSGTARVKCPNCQNSFVIDAVNKDDSYHLEPEPTHRTESRTSANDNSSASAPEQVAAGPVRAKIDFASAFERRQLPTSGAKRESIWNRITDIRFHRFLAPRIVTIVWCLALIGATLVLGHAVADGTRRLVVQAGVAARLKAVELEIESLERDRSDTIREQEVQVQRRLRAEQNGNRTELAAAEKRIDALSSKSSELASQLQTAEAALSDLKVKVQDTYMVWLRAIGRTLRTALESAVGLLIIRLALECVLIAFRIESNLREMLAAQEERERRYALREMTNAPLP